MRKISSLLRYDCGYRSHGLLNRNRRRLAIAGHRLDCLFLGFSLIA
jgi:hypothetical protein